MRAHCAQCVVYLLILSSCSAQLPLQERHEKNETPKKSRNNSRARSRSKSSESDTKKSPKKKAGDKNSSETSGSREELSDNPEYVIPVHDPLCFVHIEYAIPPKNYKYKIDIVCWGPVAKIYGYSDVKYIKTVVQDKVAYIPIFVVHYLDNLSTQTLLEWKDKVINFEFSTDKNKIANKAKTDKCQKFYLKNEDMGTIDFVEVFTEDPNDLKSKSDQEIAGQGIWKEIEGILMECLNRICQQELVISVNYKDKAHLYNVHDIIKKTASGQEISCKDGVTADGGISNKSNKKSENKQKDSIRIPVEVFLTDPVLAVFKMNESKSRMKAFVLTSSDNVLTDVQKVELNPLVVKVHKIQHLPRDVLLKNGFSSVFVNCDIPGVCNFKTQPKPVNQLIYFSEARFICTRMLSQLKLQETFQTKGATLEIFGIKSVNKLHENSANKDGIKKGKKKRKKSEKSGKKNDELENCVVLAIAKYNLSSLINNTWICLERGQCHIPNLSWCLKRTEHTVLNNLVDKLTINDINGIKDPQRLSSSPLTEDMLLSKATTLKLEVYFLTGQTIKYFAGTYKRLLLVIKNHDQAISLLNEVLLHNQKIMRQDIIPNFGLKPNCDNCEEMLTGFLIDCGDHSIFFVEGLCDGFILTLFSPAYDFHICTANTFFNSDYLFEERLYDNFKTWGGLSVITLKIPLQDILSMKNVYVEGNVPFLCWRALVKLSLLYKSTTFESVLFYEVLPTYSELVSFAIEYGLPLSLDNERILSMQSSNGSKSAETIFSHLIPDIFVNVTPT